MLPVLAIFGLLSILPVWFNLTVFRRHRVQRALRERGRRTTATLLEVGSTMGAIAVSSTLVRFAFETSSHSGATQRHEVRVVVTGGLDRPRPGDTVEVVYLPEAPRHANIVGNPGNLRTFIAPLIGLNVLWVAAGVAVIAEAVTRL